MSNSISGMGNYSYMSRINTQAMQQRNDDLLSKLDSNSDSGIDMTEFSAFAKKVSADTGNSFNVDDVFSTYDADGSGTLSSDELKNFMKDNPPPPIGMDGGMFQMNTQAMQQPTDDLFSKLDSNSDSGIDTTEFSAFATKVSANTGNSFNVDDVFSTYDADDSGTLSSDELKSFMKDNPPPPPPAQMQNAMSAYGTDQNSDQMSTLLDLLKNLSASDGSASAGDTSSISAYLSKLIENLSSGANSSLIDVTT